MKEWRSPYNPFNSFKALVWREWFEGFAKGDFLPPITVDTDPSNACNFNCIWCNSRKYRKEQPKILTTEHLLKLANFYKAWGATSTCIAGGGEPMMATGFTAFLEECCRLGIETGIITNGSLMTEVKQQIIADTAKWIGFSMDAGTPETFAKVKGLGETGEDTFKKVIRNISGLAGKNPNLDISYKYLAHPLNVEDIAEAAWVAREIGCKRFHLRPVGLDNLPMITQNQGAFKENHIRTLEEQMEKAQELESETFEVYGIRHKFNPDLSRKVNFTKCWAAPLLTTFGADGNVHLCFDMRGNPDLILCTHEPEPENILKYWNTDYHRELLYRVDPKNCPRCTFGPYNEMVEQVFMKDGMCRFFP